LLILDELRESGGVMDRQMKLTILSEGQKNGVSSTCTKYGISRTLYYRWLNRYKTYGLDGLDPVKKVFVPINKTPPPIEDSILSLIKSYPSYGPREIKYLLEEIGHKISESAVYNIMKRHDLSTKEKRTRFAKKKTTPKISDLPAFDTMKSGECWLFWTTSYGSHESVGTIYEYTILDYKSKIACSRLYNTLSSECFEDLLTAAAIPVAQCLNFNTNYLCFFQEYNISEKNKNVFLNNIQKTVQSSGFDISVFLIKDEEQYSEIMSLKKEYTNHCLSFMLPFMHSECSGVESKLHVQRHMCRDNVLHRVYFGELLLSPIEYHSYATGSNRILPLWAYIDRIY